MSLTVAMWTSFAFVGLLLGIQHASSSLEEDETRVWNSRIFPGCQICSCQRSSMTIDCSNRDIAGRLPDSNGLPHVGVISL